MALTLTGLRVVSVRFAPARLLSYCQVRTFTWAASGNASRNASIAAEFTAIRYSTGSMKYAALAMASFVPLLSGQHTLQEWPIYGGGTENIRYSKLSQINRENVKNLTVAWTF